MAEFDRSKSTLECTLALWRFRRDRGELSHFYWTGLAASELLAYTLKKHPDEADPITALGVKNPKYENRMGHSIKELRRRVKTESRWRRLSLLMLATAAFERFILGIATAAVDSDPTLSSGFPKRVDGLMLKKYGLQLNRPKLESLIKGEWSSRIAEYRHLFGSVPHVLLDAEGDLEQFRVLRNRVAHQFAFDDSSMENHLRLVLGGRRVEALESSKVGVSHERLIEWLGTLGSVSEAIDAQLNSAFIGGYETAAVYLDWKTQPDAFESSAGLTVAPIKKSSPERRFASVLSAVLDSPLGGAYPNSVQRYVSAL